MEGYLEGLDDGGWETVGKNKKGKERKKLERKDVVAPKRNQGTPKNAKMGGALRKGNNRCTFTRDAGKIDSLMPEWRRRDVQKEKKTIPKNANNAQKQTQNTPRKADLKESVHANKCSDAQTIQTPNIMQDDNRHQQTKEPLCHGQLQDQNIVGEEMDGITEQQPQNQFYIPPQYNPNGIDIQAALMQALAYNAAVYANAQNVGWGGVPSNEMGYFSLPQGFIPNQGIVPGANWFGPAVNACGHPEGNSNHEERFHQVQDAGEETEHLKVNEIALACQKDEKHDASMSKDGGFDDNMRPQFRENIHAMKESIAECPTNQKPSDENETKAEKETEKTATENIIVQQNDTIVKSEKQPGLDQCNTIILDITPEQQNDSIAGSGVQQLCVEQSSTATANEAHVQQTDNIATSEIQLIRVDQSRTVIANEIPAPLPTTNKPDLNENLQQAEGDERKDPPLDDKRSDDNTDTVSLENTNNNCREKTNNNDIELDPEKKEDLKEEGEVDKVPFIKSTSFPQTEEDTVGHIKDANIPEAKIEVDNLINRFSQDSDAYLFLGRDVLEDEISQLSKDDQGSANGMNYDDCKDTETGEKTGGVACNMEPNAKLPDIKENDGDNGIKEKVENAHDETKAMKKKKKKRKNKKERIPTYGEVIDYLMAELRKNYAG